MQAADAIDGECASTHPRLLPDALAPFLTAVRVARHAAGAPPRDEDGIIETGTNLDAVYSPILEDPVKSAKGIEAILRYVDQHGCFHSMAKETYDDVLGGVSPLGAIRTRTTDIVKQAGPDARDFAIGNFELDDLLESNKRFEELAGSQSQMNAFHVHGRGVYRHFFPLVRQWLEADWHGVRHKAYTSAACLYSTNWETRDVFDFDASSKAFYLEPGQIDDTLRLAQERFGEVDWGILLEIVSHDEWPLHILEIRSAKTEEAASAAAEALLNLLARRIVDFKFDVINGRLSINAKNAAGAAVCASVASVGLGHFESSLVFLAGAGTFGAAAGALGAAVKGASSAAVILLGARWASKHYLGRALRTAITPATYLGSALGTSYLAP